MPPHPPKLDVIGDKASLFAEPPLRASPPIRDPAFRLPVKPFVDGQPYLDVPLRDTSRPSLDTLSGLSADSGDNDNDGNPNSSLLSRLDRIALRSAISPKTWKGKWMVFWQRNKGLAFVMTSQLFGGLMNVTTRMLESGSDGMSPFQILFVRMSITAALCYIYLWWTRIEHAPFGKREVRWLLVARGLTGFFGVYGLYYSLVYLPIAEATVIGFLAPIISCWVCSLLVHEPFTRKEQIAGIISLLGVIMISQPASFFGTHASTALVPSLDGTPSAATNTTTSPSEPFEALEATPTQRLIAVAVGLMGAVGAAGAFITIRWIGQRAHPLISVNYFATWCTLVSFVALAFVPSVDFRLPSTLREWTLLFALGVCGFVMQFLLTAGLAHEKSSRATQMVYTQMLFALAFDKIFWNSTPGVWSIVGSSLVLGSAIYVAVKTESGKQAQNGGAGMADEEIALVDDVESAEAEEDGRGPLGGMREVRMGTMRIDESMLMKT
ncbi:hypothetical protein MMC13_003990 [Lambiella insularis]|nr:hypothetical protein [Lambiella insularis]